MKKSIYIAQETNTYDAIVVGSGISGGWAAKELTEKGLKTLVLERGRPVEHQTDYITEHKAPWELPMRGRVPTEVAERDYAIQRRTGQFDSTAQHWFINDRENPYVEDKPFTWIRGNHVGGRSIMWGRHCYRWSDLDFEANLRDGIAVDWPIRYRDVAPWYDYVERHVGISGEALGLAHLPDSVFQPGMELNVVEKHLRERIRAAFPERYLTIGRVAILTQALGGRAACHYCGPCIRGCSTGSYFSSQASTLPAAAATGNLTLRPYSVVHSVIFDPQTGKAAGVRVIDTETMETMEFRARLVFLCASALGSTQIMLNSQDARFPNGIANSSGVLGQNLMDHHFQVGASAIAEGFEDRYSYGNRPTGFYIPRFRNIDAATRRRDYIRGFGYQGAAGRVSWGRGAQIPGFGAELKEALREPGPWRVSMTAFGECLPRAENRVTLDPTVTDKYGIPALRISCGWGDNEKAMRGDMGASAAEMLEAAGFTNVAIYDNYVEGTTNAAPGLGIHEMGTARMGRDPKTSVLNGYNQAHDVPNLFVTDGACMTSSGCQNPSITYMALTARAVDHAVNEMKNGNL
ncbi:MAG: GMC family oxidoreductase [Rhodothermales bacterium]